MKLRRKTDTICEVNGTWKASPNSLHSRDSRLLWTQGKREQWEVLACSMAADSVFKRWPKTTSMKAVHNMEVNFKGRGRIIWLWTPARHHATGGKVAGEKEEGGKQISGRWIDAIPGCQNGLLKLHLTQWPCRPGPTQESRWEGISFSLATDSLLWMILRKWGHADSSQKWPDKWSQGRTRIYSGGEEGGVKS